MESRNISHAEYYAQKIQEAHTNTGWNINLLAELLKEVDSKELRSLLFDVAQAYITVFPDIFEAINQAKSQR